MKRLVLIIIPVLLVIIAGGVIFGIIHIKQKRKVEMTEFYLCETRFKEGSYQSAAQLFETFIKNHQRSKKAPDVYYYLATAYEKLGDRSKAMASWGKIIEKYPKSPNIAEAYYYMGSDYKEFGQYDKAIENYNVVVNKFSGTPIEAGAWYGLGAIYEMKGQEAEAINAYQKVLEKYPDSEFVQNAERGWGNINLKRFLKENAIPYEVKKGDSLVRIAAQFHISPELIKRLNGSSGVILQVGQSINVIKPDFRIQVDLTSRKLSLMSGDKLVKKYAVAIGKPETPTPVGEFKVTEKLPNPVWYRTTPSGTKEVIPYGDPRNELGVCWIGFKPAFGIHGTIEPESIGKAVSHGCVRMHNQDVEELYNIVSEDTPVKIIGETGKT